MKGGGGDKPKNNINLILLFRPILSLPLLKKKLGNKKAPKKLGRDQTNHKTSLS